MHILLFFFLIIQMLLGLLPAPDTSPPTVGAASFTTRTYPDDPNMLLATLSVKVSDPAGVASVTAYYRKARGSRGYKLAGKMKLQNGIYVLESKPFHKSQYDIRFIAVDSYGNATCTIDSLDTCPGMVVWVK